MKTCPDCAEQVLDQANVCRFCGFRFTQTSEPDPQTSLLQGARRWFSKTQQWWREVDADARRSEAARQQALDDIPPEHVQRLMALYHQADINLGETHESECAADLLDLGPPEPIFAMKLTDTVEGHYVVANTARMLKRGFRWGNSFPRELDFAQVEDVRLGRGIYRLEIILTISGATKEHEPGLSRKKLGLLAEFITSRSDPET